MKPRNPIEPPPWDTYQRAIGQQELAPPDWSTPPTSNARRCRGGPQGLCSADIEPAHPGYRLRQCRACLEDEQPNH